MTQRTLIGVTLAIVTATALACSDATAPPTSPGALGFIDADAGPDGSTLKVNAPTPVSPAGGVEVDDDDPDLVLENATAKYVQNVALSYVFEVLDTDDRIVYRSTPVPGGADGRTSHEMAVTLEFDKNFSWRAYAVSDGARGPVSSTVTFKTFNRFGVSCAHLQNELAIVQCRRAQYGFMSVPQRVEFLRRIAYDLNRAPAEHAPYGLLIKTSGHNCLGYSCDIICSNTGMHRQWDVLTDEDASQLPVWSRLGQIAVRPCEAVQ